jgi:hypothetical protein
VGALSILRVSGNPNLTSLTIPEGLTNLTAVFLRSNGLTNLTLARDLHRLQSLDVLDNRLASLTLPNGMTNLVDLFVSANALNSLTIPGDMTKLDWLTLQGNPITTLVLPDYLTDTNLLAYVASLPASGTAVYTYPRIPQLLLEQNVFPGRFQLRFTGPPGEYTLFDSSDFVTWDVLGSVSSTSVGATFNDLTVTNANQRFYRVLLSP